MFSCAGAPITHPVTGGLLGVLDITTQARNSNSILLSFAKLAARRIHERVVEEANALDHALLSDYYAACRHSGGPVLALGDEVFMMNAYAQARFDAVDQAALIDRTRDARGGTEAAGDPDRPAERDDRPAGLPADLPRRHPGRRRHPDQGATATGPQSATRPRPPGSWHDRVQRGLAARHPGDAGRVPPVRVADRRRRTGRGQAVPAARGPPARVPRSGGWPFSIPR